MALATVRAFVEIESLLSNTPGVVATLGERSPQSLTFSPEIASYSISAQPDLQLHVYDARDTTAQSVLISNAVVTAILTLIHDAITLFQSATIPVSPSSYVTTLLNAHFGEITNLLIGDLQVVNSPTQVVLPEWLSYTDLAHDNALVKIWLSDQQFQASYDVTQIVVIPPIATLDTLFSYATAVPLLPRTPKVLTQLITQAKQNRPETLLTAETYSLLNSTNLAQSTPVSFHYLTYGPLGASPDRLKQATIDYLLANSTHTIAQWTVILPDLFKTTEVVLLPMYTQIAIPALSNLPTLYSPITQPQAALTYAQSLLSYTDAHIQAHLEILTHPYQSITLLAIAGPDNRSSASLLSAIIPDYLHTSTFSTDFHRMSIATQDFVTLVQSLLQLGEVLTPTTPLPATMQRVVRDGQLYLAASLNQVNYLLKTKTN